MKNTLIKILFAVIAIHSGISYGISYSNAKAMRMNIQLNAIQYAKKDKALKIAKDLLKVNVKNSDLEQVSLEVLSRPDTEERTRKVLIQVYLKQNLLIKNEESRSKDLIKASKIVGNSAVMSKALYDLGIKNYPKMIKALQCKFSRRRRKKSKTKYPVAQQALAEAISLFVKADVSSKSVKKSVPKLIRCFKCSDNNTALACGRAIAHFKKLDNRSVNAIRVVMVSTKNEQRKTAAANLLASYVVGDKRFQRALEIGMRSRNELTRLTAASALYGKIRSHHGARKALVKLGKSAKKESYRKQALQLLKENP